jgi:hypothetical protein
LFTASAFGSIWSTIRLRSEPLDRNGSPKNV